MHLDVNESLLNFTAKFQPDFQSSSDNLLTFTPQHKQLLVSIAEQADSLLETPENIIQDKTTNGFTYPALRLKQPSKIAGLTQLGNIICEQLETSLFGTDAIVDKCHVYRQLPCDDANVVSGGSWDWHVDGHPIEFIKVLIFLTPVRAGNSCFQLCWSEQRQRAMRAQANRMDPENWVAGEGRRGKFVPEEVLDQAIAKGYKVKSFYGDAFSTIVFNTNCFHRGTVGKTGYRDTLMYRVRPRVGAEPAFSVDPEFYTFQQKDAL